MAMETEQTTDGLVIGRNAVAELLAGGREIEHVLVANGERTGSIVPLIAKCKSRAWWSSMWTGESWTPCVTTPIIRALWQWRLPTIMYRWRPFWTGRKKRARRLFGAVRWN